MNHYARAIAAIACLLSLAACKDRHEPVKPTVITPHFATADRA
ncbi:hypothetical protein ACFSQU_07455 [Massilia sp. GCM10020059]|nr:hypothetical protein [Massilia agrisoli]